jgi:CheY-like chemotaxis protein
MTKILVVDDEKDVIELLKFLLEKDGFEVETASNGREALEKIGLLPSAHPPYRPDLMILDVMMPQMDGYTVQNKLMENDEAKNIPIVILTAKGQMRDLFGMATNVVAYIEKPFDPKTLREKIKELVNKPK